MFDRLVSDLRDRYLGRARVGYARMGARLEGEIRRTSPYDTGRMQSRSRVTPRGEFRLTTLIDTFYASYLRDGTRDHGPVTADYLVFKIGDRWIKTKRVRGITPRPWYDNALELRMRFFEEERAKLP